MYVCTLLLLFGVVYLVILIRQLPTMNFMHPGTTIGLGITEWIKKATPGCISVDQVVADISHINQVAQLIVDE